MFLHFCCFHFCDYTCLGKTIGGGNIKVSIDFEKGIVKVDNTTILKVANSGFLKLLSAKLNKAVGQYITSNNLSTYIEKHNGKTVIKSGLFPTKQPDIIQIFNYRYHKQTIITSNSKMFNKLNNLILSTIYNF